jgi:hypothetical protein
MIISHSRRFVFVKTRKTASTSVEVFLHQSLNVRDIWTPLSDPKVAGNRYYSIWPFDFAAARSRKVRRWLGKQNGLYLFYLHDHSSSKELYKFYSSHRFTNYFKFCFDRNPWDYVVSLYQYEMRKLDRVPDFDTFVYTHAIPRNSDLYTIDGREAVDAIYRYEELDVTMQQLVVRLGLADCTLARHKSSLRPGRDYRDYYTPATRDRIAHLFAPVIERLNYDF